MILHDGRVLAARQVVMAIGVQPAIATAQAAGIPCQRGILVDRQLRSAHAGIYAVGECCEISGETFGLVAPCLAQAKILAAQLADRPQADFYSAATGTRLKVSGISLFSAGDVREAPSVISFDPIAGHYRRLFLKDGRLKGVLLYGDCQQSGALLNQLHNAGPVSVNTLFGLDEPETQPLAAGNPVMSQTKPVLAVVGHGMVSHHFLEQLVDRNLHQHYHVVVYGEERYQAYDRVHLSEYFTGKTATQLSLVSEEFLPKTRLNCVAVAG